MEQRVDGQRDHPRNANRERHRTSKSCGRAQRLSTQLLLAEPVTKDPGCQAGHHGWANGICQRVLHGTLPSHDFAAITGRHDVREDGEVGSRLGPGSQDAKGCDEGEVCPEASRTRRDAVELKEDQRDSDGHRDLCAQGTAMVAEAPGQGISNHPSDDVPEHAHDGALGGQDARLPVLQAAELEVEQVVPHDAPRDGAEHSLHDQDTESRDAQKVDDSAKLGAHRGTTLLLGCRVQLVGRLHEEAGNASGDAEGHDARARKEETPARDVTHVRVGHVAGDQQGAEHAKEECALHAAEDFAPAIVRGEIGDESVANRPEGGQEEAAHAPQEYHDKEIGHEGKDGDSEALPQCSDEQNVLPLHRSPVSQDPPEGCCQVGKHHLHGGQDGEVTKAEAKIPLQGELARWDQLSVQTLQGTHAAKPEENDAAGLPLLCWLLGLGGGLLRVVGLGVHNRAFVHNVVTVHLGGAWRGCHCSQFGHRTESVGAFCALACLGQILEPKWLSGRLRDEGLEGSTCNRDSRCQAKLPDNDACIWYQTIPPSARQCWGQYPSVRRELHDASDHVCVSVKSGYMVAEDAKIEILSATDVH